MGKGKAIQKGKIRASHILVDKYKQALEVMELLNNGEKFENLAKKFSTCPSRKKGGDLGKFSKGDMVKEFDKAVFALEVGTISKEPVKTKFGYHIIKRTG